ncbi:hypothetical protein [Usitatibacter palustris]|uniref:hypothetical protein n=1 Tax=Usitatibacter palustris TaxID=2732487 RepID=UPI0014888213|nr:hypothetical protein [Usitatibacter palustris]
MASRTVTYRVETTTFHPVAESKIETYSDPSHVAAFVRSLPVADRVLFVAALDLDEGVDYGNFYLFTNATGVAHIMVHEHREFLPRERTVPDGGGDATFFDEGGEEFTVPRVMTTSHHRGAAALEYWLPDQSQWPELQWE